MNPDSSSDKQAFNPAQPQSTPTLPKPAAQPQPSLPSEPTRPTAPSPDSAIPVPDPSQTTPVASAIGEIASQPEVDNSAIPNPTASEPVLPAPANPQPGASIAPVTPEASPSAPDPELHPDSKTVKLPVPTSVLPAIAIGVLVLILLSAVAALAFLG
jgi:hypothetical protein